MNTDEEIKKILYSNDSLELKVLKLSRLVIIEKMNAIDELQKRRVER